MKVAILLTVHNRVDKTIRCLNSLFHSLKDASEIAYEIFLTDDGSTDHTEDVIRRLFPNDNIYILKGDGSLFWNGGMINSWKAALNRGGYDGYLWLNNDTEIFSNLWNEIIDADQYSKSKFGQRGIYVGSTCNKDSTKLTYGGFNFVSKLSLKDEFVVPNGTFQHCQCAHGNVTYVSQHVVDKQGILYDGYSHGGGDHDYTYLAYKKGIPLIVLRDYVGICENDHDPAGWEKFAAMRLKERIKFVNSPVGFNLKNTLLFQKRCFPYRYPFVFMLGYLKVLFPAISIRLYRYLRK